ncbi:putative RNA-binding protein with PUA-like domain [Silicimonas algicola]|uniref:Putative RNA-binding protein with PUA-like domain n=1 Tax=Silicimonas algicola TaxID=1826607 RepID=A0A316G6W4_9RHOB|nr:putative RNA-binding protein with PUA-like domain [Silicimonas algicola]
MTAVAYWLFKTEPSTWGWEDQVGKGDIGQEWDGVRNYQARNNMRAMKTGDLGFFYHSQTEKAVVGIVRVTAESHPDSTTDDDRWDCVDVVAVRPVRSPVTLDDVKAEPRLKNMVLANNTRLSVQPVTEEEWKIVCGMAGLEPEKL